MRQDVSSSPNPEVAPHGPRVDRARWLMAAAGLGVILADLLIGAAVRASLPVSSTAAGWLLRPLLLYGHTEHAADRISFGAAVAVIGTAFVLWTAPRMASIPFLVPCVAVGVGAGLGNQLEVAVRGSASDYVAFRTIPLIDSGVYNLADIEMMVAFALGLCAFGTTALLSRHRLRAAPS